MNIFNDILRALLDALKDSALLIPFMFAAFIVIGLLERGAGRRMVSVILAADKVGPLAGGLLGAVPSCGFSAASSNLFGAGLLTTGTLVAVYLSTSDEMLAIMISERADVLLILKILGIKIVCGIICGLLIDGITRLVYYFIDRKNAKTAPDTEDELEEAVDDACACGCTDGCCAQGENLFLSALKRTARIVVFILAVSFVLNIALTYVDKDAMAGFIAGNPVLGNIFAALLGLVPNCAVSVALTELYLDGIITASTLLCGLMAGAGSGLIVLFRSNRNWKENLVVIALLFISSLIFGSLAGALFF